MPCNASQSNNVTCESDPVQIKDYYKKRPVSFVWIDEHLADNSGEIWQIPNFEYVPRLEHIKQHIILQQEKQVHLKISKNEFWHSGNDNDETLIESCSITLGEQDTIFRDS